MTITTLSNNDATQFWCKFVVVLIWFKDNNGNHVLWTIPFVLLFG